MKADRITQNQIENTLYLIATHGSKQEARRFDKLLFEQKQKVVVILHKRAKRAKNPDYPFADIYTIREVIDDAQRGNYFDD